MSKRNIPTKVVEECWRETVREMHAAHPGERMWAALAALHEIDADDDFDQED